LKTAPARIYAATCVAVVVAAALLGSPAYPADTNPPTGANPVAAEQRLTRPQKIEELVGYLGYGGDLKHTDAAIPYLAANVAPGDASWNKTHRRWQTVSALIGRDLREDAQEAFAESEAAIVHSAERALTDGVVSEDLDAALGFFRSATGRRFLELQNSLIDLSLEVSLEQDTGAEVSVENFDARRRVLELWLPVVFLHSIYGPQAADRAVDAAYQKYSRLRGPQLDALAQRYAADLPLFENFTRSVSFGRIIGAAKETGQGLSAPNLSAFFAAEAKRHASDWHAAYLCSSRTC
jgi:hypothetical protein